MRLKILGPSAGLSPRRPLDLHLAKSQCYGPTTLAHLRSLLVVATTIGLLPACGLLIGLNDYDVADSSDPSLGGSTNSGGNQNGSGGDDGSGGKGLGGDDASGGDDGSGGSGSGGVLVEPDCRESVDCDDENDCTADSCSDGECSYATEDAGRSCGGGICNGVIGGSQCVRCIDDQAGESQDSGCPAGAPRCDVDGTAICVGCERHSDCDDDNDCTTDTCTPTGQCSLTPVVKGEACGESMICNGAHGSEECLPCVDDRSDSAPDTGCGSASPFCDPSGTNNCQVCLNDADGIAQDSGCTSLNPICDGESCVACVGNGDCTDGISCTDDTCQGGQCENPTNDDNCSGGSVCEPMVCDASLDCQQIDVSTTTVVIDESTKDGSFELGGVKPSSTWTEVGEFFSIYVCDEDLACSTFSPVTANHGDKLAWLAGVEEESLLSINQVITLPPGTVELTLVADSYFQTEDSPTTPNDVLTVRLTNLAGAELYEIVTYSNLDADSTGGVWAEDGINVTFPASSWAGDSLKLEFEAITNDSLITDFMIDEIRLIATVCQ
jgi:hypothetical protein